MENIITDLGVVIDHSLMIDIHSEETVETYRNRITFAKIFDRLSTRSKIRKVYSSPQQSKYQTV